MYASLFSAVPGYGCWMMDRNGEVEWFPVVAWARSEVDACEIGDPGRAHVSVDVVPLFFISGETFDLYGYGEFLSLHSMLSKGFVCVGDKVYREGEKPDVKDVAIARDAR